MRRAALSVIAVLVLSLVASAKGEIVYDGIFAKGHAQQKVWVDTYWEQFLSKWQSFEKENYRLVDFEVDTAGSKPKFSGVFEGIGIPNAILAPPSPACHPWKHPWETPARLARGTGDGDWRRLHPASLPGGLVKTVGKHLCNYPDGAHMSLIEWQ
jgi:hypothetical protein